MTANAQPLNPPALMKPVGYAHGYTVTGGRTLYIAGQVAKDAEARVVGAGDLVAQFRQVCENLRTLVNAAGGQLTDVVKLTIYVLDVQDYKKRRVYTLESPLKIVSQMTTCVDDACAGHHQLMTAEEEILIAPPLWVLGWDAFAHLGQARFSRHMSVPEIREELRESYSIALSEDCIEDYIGRYQAILAARQRDPAMLKKQYTDIESVILTIDGLQPEKGHETLYTIRELNAKRVWFATPLLSSSHEEVRKLLVEAKAMAKRLGKPVRAWMSDKQDAFVTGIAEVFPGTPHRLCRNHFQRDLAEPVLEADSHAKVQMRKKVRGLRTIEKEILAREEKTGKNEVPSQGDKVVLGYCASVRGILNKNQGGPLDPPGLQMAEGLKDVRESIQRNIDLQAGGEPERNLKRLAGFIDRGLSEVSDVVEKIVDYVVDLKAVDRTLDPDTGTSKRRQTWFKELRARFAQDNDPIRQKMAGVMERFEPGLFAGGDSLDALQDNLDLERWFRLPKSHERRIHGRQHAGVRIVQEGPGLLLALDAHHSHRRPFTQEELQPYLGAKPTDQELESVERRKLMRRATSRKARPGLLGDLECDYADSTRQRRGRSSSARSGSRSHARGG